MGFLPSFLRGMDAEKLRLYGFGDNIFEILEIRTQGEFQKEFNVGHNTIAEWKKREDFKEQVKLFRKNFVFNTYKDAIDHKFSQRVMRTAEPTAVKLWHELYGDYIPTTQIQGHVTHTHVVVSNDLSKHTVLQMVLAKVAARHGIDIQQLSKEVEESYYAPLIDAEATVLDSVPLPSKSPYNVDELEVKVLGKQKEFEETEEQKTQEAFAKKIAALKAKASGEGNGASVNGGGDDKSDLMDFILGS